MRRAIIAVFAVFIVGLLAIIGWYVNYTNQIKAELTQYESESASHKKVTVEIAVTPPANTPKDQVLYLSGSVPALGNWDAAGVQLRPGNDGRHHAQVELLSGLDYSFKVTRGTWGTVEADANGKDVADRTFKAGVDQRVDVTVANWIDGGKAVPGRVTALQSVRMHPKFHSDILKNERTLAVYLPAGYDASKDRYPVLYMQDGQNLFDEFTSYQGIEWRMDETAEELIKSGKIAPVIIVGIANSPQRVAEYTPGQKGDDYVKFVVSEVKPFIDSHYRTMTDKARTGIGGASLGALIAMHAAKTNPDVFGQLVLMSPWLRVKASDANVIKDWVGDGQWLKGEKIYAEMGTEPGDNYPTTNPTSDGQQLAAALEKAGLKQGSDFVYREIEGERHNESGWSKTVDQPLLFLYGKTPTTTQSVQQ